MAGKTVIIGIGNSLLTDEGVGIRAIQVMQSNYSTDDDVEIIDGGTLSFTLLNYFDDCDNLIVIDSSNLHTTPGSVRLFVDAEVEQFLDFYTPDSVHDINLIDILSIARMMNRYPQRLALIAVQPETMSWGTELTQKVNNSLPVIGHHVNDLLMQWKTENA